MTLGEKLLWAILVLQIARLLFDILAWAETGLQARVVQLLEAINERLRLARRRDRLLGSDP